MALFFSQSRTGVKPFRSHIKEEQKEHTFIHCYTLINIIKGGCCLETGYLGYSFVPSFIYLKLLSFSPLPQPNISPTIKVLLFLWQRYVNRHHSMVW